MVVQTIMRRLVRRFQGNTSLSKHEHGRLLFTERLLILLQLPNRGCHNFFNLFSNTALDELPMSYQMIDMLTFTGSWSAL